jgi:hypothetical protein
VEVCLEPDWICGQGTQRTERHCWRCYLKANLHAPTIVNFASIGQIRKCGFSA